MDDNVKQFQPRKERDLVSEMMGPPATGRAVVIDGRLVPNMVMFDHGGDVEFILDNRLSFTFPRNIAWLAANLAFQSMAVAAGFSSIAGAHFTQLPFAPEVVALNQQ